MLVEHPWMEIYEQNKERKGFGVYHTLPLAGKEKQGDWHGCSRGGGSKRIRVGERCSVQGQRDPHPT